MSTVTVDAFKMSSWMPVSDEMLEDGAAIRGALRLMAQDAGEAFRQAELDMLYGPRLGPGRAEYNAVMAPVWRRERIRANVRAVMGDRKPRTFHRAA